MRLPPQRRQKPKKGDTVIVITGEDRGKNGKVLEVFPKENRALVQGIRIISKHTKPSAQNITIRNSNIKRWLSRDVTA